VLKEEAQGRVALPTGSSGSRLPLFVTDLRRNAK
jgi:hypothetical protein